MADDKLKWRVTPEQILETMRYFSAAELRTQQSKLSGAATQLEKLLGGRLSHLLTPDEAEIIRQAADLVRQLNTRVEHAKEIKNREEKRKEKARQLHQVAIDKALDKTLPAISRDATDIGARILSMTELLLALHAEKMTLTFMSKDELVADLRRKVDRYTARSESLWEVADYIYRDLRSGLDATLGWERDHPPQERLSAMLDLARQRIDGIRKSHAEFFAYLQAQVAIEESTNVERLPVRPKRQ